MLPNTLTFSLFMFPVISFMAALVMINLLPRLDSLGWPFRRKTDSRRATHTRQN
ncbi:MAG: hypothetical protein MJK04_11500 [Psychrosphaera sp.]|nr:hypothetical protein [Psychrosphaera sp.]